MKTGIIGGTFNPIHNAHLKIATELLEYCQLDRVIFIPAALPPHKHAAKIVAFEHRLQMVRCAISAQRQFEVSDIERQRGGKSYSVDTLKQLHQRYPADEFYFLIGMDSFINIATWHKYKQLFTLCNLVIAQRPGATKPEQPPELPVAIRQQFCYDAKLDLYRHKSGHRLIFLQETFLDISSTQIRKKIAQQQPIETLLPAPVAQYIHAHKLYVPPER
ncbi:MAG: nicotinate-nucleotide adenylyltransferase [Desulfuromonas sp.]|nr:nicotinate-nucleotide adenylyltransferase [Desulfuromonas sp.]